MLQGPSFQFAFLLVLLLAIAINDYRTMTIPNGFNFVLGAGGVGFALSEGTQAAQHGMVASLLGGGFLLLVRSLHMRLRGIQGLGLGDVKFMFAAGFWLTPFHLPWLVLIASASGLVTAIATQNLKGQDRIAFGPHLALGTFACWLLKVNNVL